MNVFDSHTIEIPCPHCSRKASQTVGRLKLNPNLQRLSAELQCQCERTPRRYTENREGADGYQAKSQPLGQVVPRPPKGAPHCPLPRWTRFSCRHLHSYVFSSCQRLTGGRLGLNLRISDSLRTIHFGPPLLPIVRAQFTATNHAPRKPLNADALTGRDVAMTQVIRVQKPLPDGNFGNLKRRSQRTLAAEDFNDPAQGRKIWGFHGRR